MAYMRGSSYIWSDGENLHLMVARGATEIPMDLFDELVAMRWHQMDEEEQQHAMQRAFEGHYGNFGCDGVAKALGHPSAMEAMRLAREEAEKLDERR